MKKYLFLLICVVGTVINSIEAACMGGRCKNKQPRMHETRTRGCTSCSSKNS